MPLYRLLWRYRGIFHRDGMRCESECGSHEQPFPCRFVFRLVDSASRRVLVSPGVIASLNNISAPRSGKISLLFGKYEIRCDSVSKLETKSSLFVSSTERSDHTIGGSTTTPPYGGLWSTRPLHNCHRAFLCILAIAKYEEYAIICLRRVWINCIWRDF